jgi:hypothetical protein
MSAKDESYVIDLCDEVLGRRASRQHRFPFLVGDAGTWLPVDAYYADLQIVIEYRERQHFESVKFFDKPEKLTCSGVPRSKQRELYDQRRRDVLPAYGIRLIELPVTVFQHSAKKRLRRNRVDDEMIVRRELAAVMRLDTSADIQATKRNKH